MRALLVRLDHMGDIVLTVPPVAASLRAAYPGTRLDALTTSAGGALLHDDPNIDDLIVFDPPWSVPPPDCRSTPKWSYLTRCAVFLYKRLQRSIVRYDVVIFLSFSPWERLLVSWQGKRSAGFSGPYRRRLTRMSTHLLKQSVPFRTDQHVLENAFNLVQSVFPKAAGCTGTRIAISGERRSSGRELLREATGETKSWVMFHAGTSKSMKSWSFEKYLDVAETLEREFHTTSVFVGTPREVEFYKRECLRRGRTLPRLCPTPGVDDLMSVAANSVMFVGNDGGPMHIASALGIPTVAVFGPTDERVYGPRGPLCRIVRESGICGRKQYPWNVEACCHETGRECLTGIQESTVLDAARDMFRHRTGTEKLSSAAIG